MQMKYGIIIDKGKKREYNDDAAVALPAYGFFAVSDGMGGLALGGKTALETVLFLKKTIPLIVKETTEADKEKQPSMCAELFLEALAEFNEKVYHAGNEYDMPVYGATLVCAWFINSKIVFVNIGDSRAYLKRENRLVQKSKDHNVAAMMVEKGYLSKESAEHSPLSSKLMQYIGVNPQEYNPELVICDARKDDVVLLCSDGLYGMLEDKKILQCITDDLETSCKVLVNAANKAGGKDNISVILASCTEKKAEDIVLFEDNTDKNSDLKLNSIEDMNDNENKLD